MFRLSYSHFVTFTIVSISNAFNELNKYVILLESFQVNEHGGYAIFSSSIVGDKTVTNFHAVLVIGALRCLAGASGKW